MKTEIFFVKSLEKYLQGIVKPILQNPSVLKSGRPYKNIKLRPREVLGTFLICVTIRYISKQDWTIARDPDKGDGVVWCRERTPYEGAFLEQVYVRLRSKALSNTEIVERVKQEVDKKVKKGKPYSKNRHLIIYLDAGGFLDHKSVKNYVNKLPSGFDSYWLFANSSESKLTYVVFLFKAETDQPAAYQVEIKNSFDGWEVARLGSI